VFDIRSSEQYPGMSNTLIDKELEYFKNYGPQIFPAVVINNQTFRGQLEIEAVFNAICAGFYTEPKFCKKLLDTNNVNSKELLLHYGSQIVISHMKVLSLCIVICLVVVIMLCYYRRHAKREMKRQMNDQIESAVG